MGQSMAEDLDPKFTYEMLKQCYSTPNTLIEYNMNKHNWDRYDAEVNVEVLCGRLLTKAKEIGVGVILLNMYESKNSGSKF